MPPFFSYSTLSSFGAGTCCVSTVTATAGEAMTSSPLPSFLGRARPCSHVGAEPGDLLADDQVLHLICTFVGVERLGIREEARHVIIDEDAVAAEQLSRPGNRLARLGRRERLRERRLLFRKLALVRELCRANHHALAGRDVAEHFRKQILYELERADRLSELQSLLGVLDRVLVGAHLDARRLPPDEIPRPTQHARGVAEGLSAGREPIFIRHPAVLHGDLTVLDHLEGDLALHLLDAEAGRGFVFDDEALDLVVGQVARPDDRDIAPGGVADPPLLAVEDPGVAFALRRRGEAAAGSRADQWLGQAEAADLFHARHRRQPLLLLLLRSDERDRTHRQAAVDAEEGRD